MDVVAIGSIFTTDEANIIYNRGLKHG